MPKVLNVNELLHGVIFPVQKDYLIKVAKARKLPMFVVKALERTTMNVFKSKDELISTVRAIF